MGNSSEWLAAYSMLGAISVGLGLTLLLAQERTRTNLSIGAIFVLVGVSYAGAASLANEVDASNPGLLPGLLALLEGASIAALCVYVRGLLDTAQATPRAERAVSWTIKFGFVLAAWHAGIYALFPAERLNDFQFGLFDESANGRAGFWLFAVTWIVLAVNFTVTYAVLLRQTLDPAERARVLSVLIAQPMLISTTFLPLALGPILGTVSMLIALFGQMRYNVLLGRQGGFLSRFLSDQVRDLVRTAGLADVMKPHELDLTVVSCDLRGFTRYAEAVPSQVVIDLLDEYYGAVGEAVARHGGTIKDYTGDGVLILVGAPLPRIDHAVAGLDLARRLHEMVHPVLERWATGPHPLGLGVGIASGRVTVGAVGSASRMEYTAVGTAVNVAARLCSAAADGEVLVDQSTAHLTAVDGLRRHTDTQIKGLGRDQLVYVLDAASARAQAVPSPREPPTLSSAPGSTTS